MKTNYMVFRVFAGNMMYGLLINYKDNTQSFMGAGNDELGHNSLGLQSRILAYKRLTLKRLV